MFHVNIDGRGRGDRRGVRVGGRGHRGGHLEDVGDGARRGHQVVPGTTAPAAVRAPVTACRPRALGLNR